jgi:(heptosyl)LPS beta-1,4-glucosyltransferase
MPRISVVIIALQEQERIEQAVCSARPWVDEVVVLDGGSVDGTCARATAAGARVLVHPFDGFVAQKQRAVDAATHDHVFVLDADERIGPDLGAALAALRRGWPERVAGFRVARWNYLDGAPLRGAGWWSDRPVRLFDRRRARLVGREPHDRVALLGPRGPLLPGALHHDVDRDTRAYVRATVAHARRASRALATRGRPGALTPWLRGVGHFARKVVLGAAPLHGRRGMTVAWVGAKGVTRKYRLARRVSS